MQMLMYASNLKLKTCISILRRFSLVLAMAPKISSGSAATCNKRKQCDKVAFIPADAVEAAADTADTEVAPFVECKTEDNDDEAATSGSRRASKGSGMNPLEVSRMLTMLGKRRKKDHACLRIRNTYVCAYLVFKFIPIHISMYMCLYLFMYIRCTCM